MKDRFNFLTGIERAAVFYNEPNLLQNLGTNSPKFLTSTQTKNSLSLLNFSNNFGVLLGNRIFDRSARLRSLLDTLIPHNHQLDITIRDLILAGLDETAHQILEKEHNMLSKNADIPSFETVNISLLDLRWNFSLKLILFGSSASLVGYQHGGSYGLYKNNVIEKIERSACDDFIEWNVFSPSPKCLRYPKLPDLSFGRGCVAPHLTPNQSWEYLNAGLYKHCIENPTYNVLEEYSNKENLRFLDHPKVKVTKPGLWDRIPNLLKLSTSHVNYFSYFGSTMFEYAVSYGIPSKLLITNDPDIRTLTEYGVNSYDALVHQKKVVYL